MKKEIPYSDFVSRIPEDKKQYFDANSFYLAKLSSAEMNNVFEM